MSNAGLVESLSGLRGALSAVRLPLTLPGSDEAKAASAQMVTQLDDYILPRLDRLDAPLLAVVGGSTGAGKSTLVNSLIGRVVSRPGVIRPTTRSPVLVHNPADLEAFSSERVLPGLARTFGTANDTSTLQLVAEPSLPQGLALLDAPDIDSVVKENRALAAQLLSAADLWLFVTTAARYADAVPWDYLAAAAQRSAAVAVVLQRVPPAAMYDVPAHLGQLMTQRGLGGSPLFAVPETTTDANGLLPDAAVAPIRDWLATLAADQLNRQAVVMQTLDGAISSLVTRTPTVITAMNDQSRATDQLWEDAAKSYAEAARAMAVQTADGTMLRGEVLSRWQDFVGTGEFMRGVEARIGRLRDRLFSAVRGERNKAEDAQVAVQSGLEVLLREEGDAAAERVENAWRGSPAGRQVMERAQTDLSHSSADFSAHVATLIRDWQGDVLDLVSAEGAGKKTGARVMAFGVNGVGLALMMIVFFNTGGLTGAEVGIAGGTVVLAQRFLEAIFGEDGVRRMAKVAKEALDARVEALMASELDRYRVAIDALGIEPSRAEALQQAWADLRDRRADGASLDAGAGRALLEAAPATIAPAASPSSRSTVDDAPTPLRSSDGGLDMRSSAEGVRLGTGGIILPEVDDDARPAAGFTAGPVDAVSGTVLDTDDPQGVRVEPRDG